MPTTPDLSTLAPADDPSPITNRFVPNGLGGVHPPPPAK